MRNAWMHWSGGKDSAYTLWKLLEESPNSVCGLVTSMSAEFRRVSMHGVPEELLDAQVNALNLPLEKLLLAKDITMADYSAYMAERMQALKAQGAETCIFGDIFLEDLRAYREAEMEKCGLKCEFPIWKEAETAEIAQRIIKSGIKALVVCVSGKFFDESYLGRDYDADFLANLPEGVDPCGENGEFHTFVYDGPTFSEKIEIELGEKVNRLYTPGSTGEEDEDCECCKTWDTEFYFQEIRLKK